MNNDRKIYGYKTLLHIVMSVSIMMIFRTLIVLFYSMKNEFFPLELNYENVSVFENRLLVITLLPILLALPIVYFLFKNINNNLLQIIFVIVFALVIYVLFGNKIVRGLMLFDNGFANSIIILLLFGIISVFSRKIMYNK
ncbi:MAG TPA: hypothetical protein VKY32_00155 [Flavobacterium sp.]|nr:hypothetical protein [Flavobacterium sp.]